MASIQANAYAPGTWRNLRSQWKSFLHFCEQFTFAPLPASPQTLSAYASFLSCKTSSFNYVMNHLNAARLFHLYKGFSTESFNSFTLSLTKKGLKRTMGSFLTTPDILVSMRRSLDLTTPLTPLFGPCLPQRSFPFCESQIWSRLQPLQKL